MCLFLCNRLCFPWPLVLCLTCLLALKVSVQLYSPRRPTVDVAEVFLWLMAVGTIICASYWSAGTAREDVIEREKLLKVTWFLFMSIVLVSQDKRKEKKNYLVFAQKKEQMLKRQN